MVPPERRESLVGKPCWVWGVPIRPWGRHRGHRWKERCQKKWTVWHEMPGTCENSGAFYRTHIGKYLDQSALCEHWPSGSPICGCRLKDLKKMDDTVIATIHRLKLSD